MVDAVRLVQQKLKAAGFDPGPIDNLWGGATEDALDQALALAKQARSGESAFGPAAVDVPASDILAAVERRFGDLNASQEEGLRLILDTTAGWPIEAQAYLLATAWHETKKTLAPVVENLNYSAEALIGKFSPRRISVSDAQRYGRTAEHRADQERIANLIYGGVWGLENLGNDPTQPDGWRYRGRGLVQITGRGAYRRLGEALGLPLEDDPDLALDQATSTAILAVGMKDGLFSRRKLGAYVGPGLTNFVAARIVVNGSDEAHKIAEYAERYLAALRG